MHNSLHKFFMVFDDEDKGKLTKIQRVKKTKVKTTRALLRWNLRGSGVGTIVNNIYIYISWLWGPKVSIPKLMGAKASVEANIWKGHSERPRHLNVYTWNCFIPLVSTCDHLAAYSSPNSKGISKRPWKISGQDLPRVESSRKSVSLSPTKRWYQLHLWFETIQWFTHGRYLAWRLPQGSLLIPVELQVHACPTGVGLNACFLHNESSRSHLPAIRD